MSDLWLHDRYDWMTRQSWRSPTGQSFWPAGRMTAPSRVIISHSTETLGFPGYRNGADAPHFTINLITGETRQHIPLNWGSRCLAVSTGGVTDRTVNITGTVQIEVIGAVTPGYPRTYGHYDLPGRFPTDTRAQTYLARLWRAIHDATGVPLELSGYATWVSYPASYGVHARQRLSSAQFRDARGVLGHQHAVANAHGDGVYGRVVNGRAVDKEATLIRARGAVPAPPAPGPLPTTPGLPWQVTASAGLNARSGPGTSHAVVGSVAAGGLLVGTGSVNGRWVQARSHALGRVAWFHADHLVAFRVDAAHQARVKAMLTDLGYTGPDVWTMTAAYQTDHNLTPDDGLPGPATTTHMEDYIMTLKADIAALRQHVTDRTTVTLRPPTAAMIGAAANRKIPMEQALDLALRSAAYAHAHSRQAEAHAAASEAALEELAGQTAGVDVEAVKAASRKGAAEALAQVKFDVTAASATSIDQEED